MQFRIIKGCCNKCRFITDNQHVDEDIIKLASEMIELFCDYRKLISKFLGEYVSDSLYSPGTYSLKNGII